MTMSFPRSGSAVGTGVELRISSMTSNSISYLVMELVIEYFKALFEIFFNVRNHFNGQTISVSFYLLIRSSDSMRLISGMTFFRWSTMFSNESHVRRMGM